MPHVAGGLTAIVVLSLCGCAPVSQGSDFRVATAPAGSAGMMFGLASGELNGRANPDGTACFWLGEDPGGVALFWPHGYSARGNPLSVVDDFGRIAAVTGQHVNVGGGRLPDSVHSILGCASFDRFWAVGNIVPSATA